MITLTKPDGAPVDIDGTLVFRARRAIAGERKEEKARTRIDWVDMQLVREPIDDVAPLIRAELPTFTVVTSRDGSPIWFDGREAVGPFPLTPSQDEGIVRSAIKLMGYRQYVTETPDEVRTILGAAGGTVLP